MHLHSTFALDGRFTPAELAPRLANRGYAIGYITDEPVGWGITTQPLTPLMSGTGRPNSPLDDVTLPPDIGTNRWLSATFPNREQHLPWLATWGSYRAAVFAASTAQVAMFPGAEISASTASQTHTGHHNGHALAHGIQNLTGPPSAGTFETIGLRYGWFLPNTLLSNINLNQFGVSSASIAHPTGRFRWPLFGPSPDYQRLTTVRYDGFELMSGPLQTNFAPSASPMEAWRREIVANLAQTFLGNGFPSARTGSDWGGDGSQFIDISYFTFIGLPSRPSDMRHLLQDALSASLRAGRTIASRLGGIAALRLRNTQGTLQEIGSRFTMPVNATVSGDIVLRAARSGTYTVRIIENSSGDSGLTEARTSSGLATHQQTHSLTAGQTIVIPVSFRFAGGQRAFHVVVEHSSILANDIIYTSPIFIRQ